MSSIADAVVTRAVRALGCGCRCIYTRTIPVRIEFDAHRFPSAQKLARDPCHCTVCWTGVLGLLSAPVLVYDVIEKYQVPGDMFSIT